MAISWQRYFSLVFAAIAMIPIISAALGAGSEISFILLGIIVLGALLGVAVDYFRDKFAKLEKVEEHI